MKNRAKKNNKGFSLVELIVVVLIIGVIAVALAPQVMKWVDTSKKNTDLNNAETLQSSVQAALADWQNAGHKLSEISTSVIYNVKDNDATISTGTETLGLLDCIDTVTGEDYPTANSKLTGDIDYKITVYATGKVTVECAAQTP